MADSWRQVKDRSPNRRLAAGKVALVQLTDTGGGAMQDLLYALCGAATVEATAQSPLPQGKQPGDIQV
jgi:hypothetical protein